MVGEGIPKASQPSVRGCFKVTVRFVGWASCWISGGTKEVWKWQKKRRVNKFVWMYLFRKGKRSNQNFLTVYFESCLSFHRACLIGCHTHEIPTMAGRCRANYESTILADFKVRLFRVNFQAIPEPAYLWTGRTWMHGGDDKIEYIFKLRLDAARRQDNWSTSRFMTKARVTRFKKTSGVQSQAGIKQVCFCWLLVAQELQMTEGGKQAAMVAYIVANGRWTCARSSTVWMTSPVFQCFHIQLEPHRYHNILPQYTILPRVQFPFVHMFTVMGFWGEKNKKKSLPHCEEEMHTDVLL